MCSKLDDNVVQGNLLSKKVIQNDGKIKTFWTKKKVAENRTHPQQIYTKEAERI